METKFDFSFMLVALTQSIKYVPITLILAIVPFIVGLVIGTLIALARFYKVPLLNRVLQIYVVIIKGTPVVLLLILIYTAIISGFDGVAEKLHLAIRTKDINTIYIAFIALSSFSIVNISETMRGALFSVDKGQYEAAYSVGMTTLQTLRRIIFPQILPISVPMLCSNLIGLVKGSSLAFMISVTEVLNAALITATSNYNFLEAYVAAAMVYWVICITIEGISHILGKRLRVYVSGAAV